MEIVRGGSPQLLREINKQTVLRAVEEHKQISRAGIAKVTKLSRTAISSLVDELLATKVLIEKGHDVSTGGRRGILLEINPDGCYAVGADINSRKITAILVNNKAEILELTESKFSEGNGREALNALLASIGEIIDKSPVDTGKIRGIGISSSGLVETKRGIVRMAINLEWRDLPLRDKIRAVYNMPVLIENNNKAAALGEKWYGAGRGNDNLVYINVGRGVGAGIIINGKIYRGPSETAGEIGHITVDKKGPLCKCGNYGCLEALVSGPAIAGRMVDLIRRGFESSFVNGSSENLLQLTGEDISQAAVAGDRLAQHVLQEAGEWLGIGIANMVNLFNPQMIIIGGGVSKAGKWFLDTAKKTVHQRALPISSSLVNITLPELGKNSSVIGAACLVLREPLRLSGHFTSVL